MNVFMIAYYFPPESGSGSLRPLFFANHLADSGDDVHVFTAKVEDYLYDQTQDADLVEQIHPKVKITHCSVFRPREALFKLRKMFSFRATVLASKNSHATFSSNSIKPTIYQRFKDIIIDLLATPDRHAGWIFDCLRRVKIEINKRRPDIIYTTGGPWSSLISGVLLKIISRVPVILDFRDPWISNPVEKQRSPLTRSINKHLEKFVVQYADGIVANTEGLRNDFISRYPRLNPNQIITITNGFEEYLPISDTTEKHPFTIVYTGSLYSTRNPLQLIKAINGLINNRLIHPSDLKLKIVGGEIDITNNEIAEMLSLKPLQKIIEIIPRVPYKLVPDFLRNADILLLIQPDFPLQIPRKVYEYISARKPILCISERDSSTGALIRDYNLGIVCENTVVEIENAIKKIFLSWENGDLSSSVSNNYDNFKNSELTYRLRTFIDVIIKNKYNVPKTYSPGI